MKTMLAASPSSKPFAGTGDPRVDAATIAVVSATPIAMPSAGGRRPVN